jgi:hypothetical protein
MSSWAERARLRAEAAARAAVAVVSRGVKFIGNATGASNIAKSPTRKASPHHRNRNATRRALKPTARVTPTGSAPQRPGRGALKFRRAAVRHERASGSKKRTVKKTKKAQHKGRKATRRHKKREHR